MYFVRQRVKVTDPLNFGGGTSAMGGLIGTVTEARRRSCDVLLDGDDEPIWFANRELTALED